MPNIISKMTKNRKYIIGSGWWCNGKRHAGDDGKNKSSDYLRTADFFLDWCACVKKYLSPEKIIIIDSDSPIKPKLSTSVEFVSLCRNFKHASVSDTKYCGWTRAFFMGAFYAMMNDCDYVFLEQDVIFKGDIVESAFDNLGEGDYSHGLWEHKYRVEQSFVVMKKHCILSFINSYMRILKTDKQLKPEIKFDMVSKEMNFVELPFGYGRSRPVDFTCKEFYLQQLSSEELQKMRDLK
jgi:hypothetical protein